MEVPDYPHPIGGGWILSPLPHGGLVQVVGDGVTIGSEVASAYRVLTHPRSRQSFLLLRWTDRLCAYYCPPLS